MYILGTILSSSNVVDCLKGSQHWSWTVWGLSYIYGSNASYQAWLTKTYGTTTSANFGTVDVSNVALDGTTTTSASSSSSNDTEYQIMSMVASVNLIVLLIGELVAEEIFL